MNELLQAALVAAVMLGSLGVAASVTFGPLFLVESQHRPPIWQTALAATWAVFVIVTLTIWGSMASA